MKIYLDNCCFNRPFDDQSQLRIRLETEVKLKIQEDVRAGLYDLVWSYILDYENNKNPFMDRQEQIRKWRSYAAIDIEEDEDVLKLATMVSRQGVRHFDALHIACAIRADANYFLTTDDGIIKRTHKISEVRIVDPMEFIKGVAL